MKFDPIALLNHCHVSLKDCQSLREDSRFRKASTNMLLAFQTLKNLMTSLDKALLEQPAACVLATSRGELETSTEFFKHYNLNGIARPILFQSSLHNSTLSFVMQSLSFKGMALTTSNSYFSGEKALETAALLLNQNVVKVCFVLGVDSVVPELNDIYQALVPPIFNLGSGCGGITLASADCVHNSRTPFIGTLKTIDYLTKTEMAQPEMFNNYYDSNALECLGKAIEKSRTKLYLPKPDARASVIEWAPASRGESL